MAGALRLSDLATAQGALRLQRALGSTDDQAARSMVYARRFLESNPELSGLNIGLASSSYFDHDKPRVGISQASPEILAHEIGHAADLGLDPSLYKNTVTPMSKKINRAMDTVALPGATALATFFDKDTATKYLNTASMLAAVTAAPTIYNEAVASHLAGKASGNYMKTVAQLTPGLMAHTMSVLSPVAKLQAIKYIKDLPQQEQATATALVGTLAGTLA
jgi:hypothetical protein